MNGGINTSQEVPRLMLQVIRQYGRYSAAVIALLALPSFAQAGVVMSHNGGIGDFKYGQVRFHPKSETIDINSQLGGTATFRVSQKGNKKEHFKGQIGCALNLGSPPKVSMAGRIGTITVPPQKLIGISVDCTVTVLGEGGVTGSMPVLIDLNL
jgi:hypothetical protein